MSGLHPSLPLFVAQRYLRSTRRDAFVTFLSVTAIGGIALGVAALILSSAALTGFQDVLRTEVLDRTPHLEVTLPVGTRIEVAVSSAAQIEGVKEVRVSLRGKGWLMSSGRALPAEIVGFQGELPSQFPGATGREAGLYVSDRLARSWGLQPGEVIEVVSARPTLTPLGPQPRIRRVALTGTFEAGKTEQEDRVALPVEEATHLFGRTQQRLLITTRDHRSAPAVAERARGALPSGSLIATWKDSNKALLFLLRLEKTLMFVAVFLIVVVAAMAVISDLMLILTHKQGEMGMLGAMGAPPAMLRQVFLWLGSLLVGFGALTGTLLGVGGAWMLDRFRLLSLPGDVYFMDHVPFLVRPSEVLLILVSTAVLTLTCAWFAAARAASLRPVEALNR